MVFVCWSLTSLCHSNGHIETMPAREINPFTALTRIRSQFLRTQWSTSNHSEWTRLYALDRSAIGAGGMHGVNNIISVPVIVLTTLIRALGLLFAFHDYVSMLSTVLIWRHIALCGFAAEVSLMWNLNLRLFLARKCIWYPFSCDMGLYGTQTSHIELVCDSFDMTCHLNPYRTRMDTICMSYASKYCASNQYRRPSFFFIINPILWETPNYTRCHNRISGVICI